MTAYVVRHRETKTILGLFVAPNMDWLWDSVDATADPADYEWSRVSRGGLYFPREEYDIIARATDEDADPAVVEAPLHVELEDHLWNRIMNGRMRWTRFDYADEGHGMIARVMRRERGAKSPNSPTRPKNPSTSLGPKG